MSQDSPAIDLALDHPAISRPLVFELQTGDDDSDRVTWRGDIDTALGLPEGALPRTFSAWLDALHPDDQDAVLNAIEAQMRSDEPYRIECRARHADGHLLHWAHSGQTLRDENGEPITFIGTLEPLNPQPAETPQQEPEQLLEQVEAAPTNDAEPQAPPLEENDAQSTDDQIEEPTAEEPTAEEPTVLNDTEELPLETNEDIKLAQPEEEQKEAEPLPVAMQSEQVLEEEVFPHAESVVAVFAAKAEEETPISAEQRVREEQARAQSLLRAAAHLNAQLDLQEVCEAICEEAARTLDAPSAVMLFNKQRDAFVPSAVHGMPTDYDKLYTPTPRLVYDGHVAAMGTLFLFTDAQATPDLPNHALYQQVNMRTIGIASLIRDGEVLGLLKVYSFGETRTFTANELALLQGLADIAAQAIANARLLADSERRLANLGALRQIDKAILGSSDVNLALGVVLEQVVSRLGSDASSALLLDPHTRTLRYAVGRGFRTNTPRRTDWRLGEGLAGRAALDRCVIHVPDLSNPELIAADFTAPDLKLAEAQPAPEAINSDAHQNLPHNGYAPAPHRRTGIPSNESFVSYYGVPLIANGKVQGVLEVWHRSPYHLDEEELEFLETLAGQAAIAVDNATLFRDLQRTNDELVLAYDSTLAGWSGALDLRDKETSTLR